MFTFVLLHFAESLLACSKYIEVKFKQPFFAVCLRKFVLA